MCLCCPRALIAQGSSTCHAINSTRHPSVSITSHHPPKKWTRPHPQSAAPPPPSAPAGAPGSAGSPPPCAVGICVVVAAAARLRGQSTYTQRRAFPSEPCAGHVTGRADPADALQAPGTPHRWQLHDSRSKEPERSRPRQLGGRVELNQHQGYRGTKNHASQKRSEGASAPGAGAASAGAVRMLDHVDFKKRLFKGERERAWTIR